jgi:hypothetical protein
MRDDTVRSKEVVWYHRYRDLRLKLAMWVSGAAIIIGGIVWLKDKLLSIDPGKGVPLGLCVRTEGHIATLIQTLEPYTPSLHRDGSKDRFSVSLFIVPLDGDKPKLVPILSEQPFSAIQLAKVLGSDGRTLWFDVHGIGGVDLKTFELVPADRTPAPGVALQGAWTSPFPPRTDAFLAAGYISAPGQWVGLHSIAELEGEFKPQKFVRRVVRQEEAGQERRFCRATLEAPVNDKYHRVQSIAPVNDGAYLNAAFLRPDEESEPFRFTDPEGALMIFTSELGRNGRLMVARVDLNGRVIWQVDTGVERFKLEQVLPGERSTAFVGTRPPVEGEVSEPLLVIVDHTSGSMKSHSLWR